MSATARSLVSARSRAREDLGRKLARVADHVAPRALTDPEGFLGARGWTPAVDAFGPAWRHPDREPCSVILAVRLELANLAGRALALCGWHTGRAPIEPHWFCGPSYRNGTHDDARARIHEALCAGAERLRYAADSSATGSVTAVAARFDAKRVAREMREAMARETEAGWSL